MATPQDAESEKSTLSKPAADDCDKAGHGQFSHKLGRAADMAGRDYVRHSP
jgi:hypothetical protein